MLPQMMPMPWVWLFILLFLSFFTVSLLFSNQYINLDSVKGLKMKSNSIKMNW